MDFLNRPRENRRIVLTDPETGRTMELPGITGNGIPDITEDAVLYHDTVRTAEIVTPYTVPKELSFEAELDTEKMFGRPPKCRTRKRYVKLLMSKGYSRNDAHMEANAIKRTRRYLTVSYQGCWKAHWESAQLRALIDRLAGECYG